MKEAAEKETEIQKAEANLIKNTARIRKIPKINERIIGRIKRSIC